MCCDKELWFAIRQSKVINIEDNCRKKSERSVKFILCCQPATITLYIYENNAVGAL